MSGFMEMGNKVIEELISTKSMKLKKKSEASKRNTITLKQSKTRSQL